MSRMLMPSAESHPAPPRQPLALRELFCLVTLFCVLATLVFRGQLTRDEQCLLGIAAGGTLLGVFIGRASARPGWLWGLLGGVLATCGAVNLLALNLPNGIAALPQSSQQDALESYQTLKLASLGVGLVVVAATTAVQSLLVGLLSVGVKQLSPRLRRIALSIMAIFTLTGLAVVFKDHVLERMALSFAQLICP